jgi:hypothetical protein
MAQFKAFSDDSETLGNSFTIWTEASGFFKQKMQQIMKDKGIKEIQRNVWYPTQLLLDVCKIIYETVGPNTLFLIGKYVPEHAVFPPDIDSLGKALASIDTAYRMNNRGKNIGYYRFKRTGERMAAMICSNPFPCDFDRGIISAMIDKFKPKGYVHKARLTHEEGSCTYIISW